MTTLTGLDRITFDPQIMAGQACIRGMRIPISLVINLIANGLSITEIINDYPYLEPEDIQQSLKYAAWLTQERVIFFPQTAQAV
ncbi:DUF433 domain-containing protein [Phormidium tenue]|nr:DUF433 domain-containing protein [Phormidium tenue]